MVLWRLLTRNCTQCIYILACFAEDPELAIIRAVNDTKDNDTIASIVGAVVGALHGKSAFPKRWLEGLSKKLDHDPNKLSTLVEKAKLQFGEKVRQEPIV